MANIPNAESVITLLELAPLPVEGGFFRQTYFAGDPDRPETTAIYYLVTPTSFSSVHRLAFDELFHFYAGDACEMIQIDPNGELHELTIGNDLNAGQRPQAVVRAGSWQGTKLIEGGAWALLGTTMTPGYRTDIFELPKVGEFDALSDEVRSRISLFTGR